MIKLICPVCKNVLHKKSNSYVCISNHNFDIARSGYVNLLLNKPNSGDNKLMINARHNIHQQGFFSKVVSKIIEMIDSNNIKTILDAGCGEGYYSREIYNALGINICGIDVSKYAINKAKKLCPSITYVIASNYDIPLDVESVDAILNVFAPDFEKEFERVSKEYIIKVIPDEYHLFELKNALYDKVIIKKPKVPSYQNFKLIDEISISYSHKANSLIDLIKMTPFYYNSKINENINIKYVTIAVKILLYKKMCNFINSL
ncbi:MAG TPA: methyltransferase domain-containing protein [Acholeplasmataceae bacterium]|nr:methyltransferase domain-containing protein [Acholeplasmataceae bacterium]